MTLWASTALCALSVSLLMSGTTGPDDWPCWRGPNQNGALEAPGQFGSSSFGLEILWKNTLGAGYAGIAVAGRTVLTMFTDGESDLLAAFNARTGEEIWRHRLGAMYRAHDGGQTVKRGRSTVSQHSRIIAGRDGGD